MGAYDYVILADSDDFFEPLKSKSIFLTKWCLSKSATCGSSFTLVVVGALNQLVLIGISQPLCIIPKLHYAMVLMRLVISREMYHSMKLI